MLALLFSGQGAQYCGMMRDIAKAYPLARQTFEEAGDVLSRDVAALCWDSPQGELDQTLNTQPAVVTAQIAALRVLQNCGIEAKLLAGFSLGEWSALVAAGAVAFEELLPLVELRAAAMQDAVPVGQGVMAALIGIDAAEVQKLCGRFDSVWPSNYNCPGQTTVAGTVDGVSALLKAAADEGIVAQLLSVSIPSHCPLMQPAVRKLQPVVLQAPIVSAGPPLVMNATASPTTVETEIRKGLVEQLTQPVLFEQSIRLMLDRGIDAFVEIGPGKVLSGFVRRTAKRAGKKISIYCADTLDDLNRTIEEIGLS